jgi:hypothetical protein
MRTTESAAATSSGARQVRGWRQRVSLGRGRGATRVGGGSGSRGGRVRSYTVAAAAPATASSSSPAHRCSRRKGRTSSSTSSSTASLSRLVVPAPVEMNICAAHTHTRTRKRSPGWGGGVREGRRRAELEGRGQPTPLDAEPPQNQPNNPHGTNPRKAAKQPTRTRTYAHGHTCRSSTLSRNNTPLLQAASPTPQASCSARAKRSAAAAGSEAPATSIFRMSATATCTRQGILGQVSCGAAGRSVGRVAAEGDRGLLQPWVVWAGALAWYPRSPRLPHWTCT